MEGYAACVQVVWSPAIVAMHPSAGGAFVNHTRNSGFALHAQRCVAVTRSEARQHGRLLLTRGMLVGTDNQHVVVVEQRNTVGPDKARTGDAIASPSVSKFLAERLAGPDTTPAES